MFVAILAGCEPAQSNDGGNDNMIFGLFKGRKLATAVAPEVGQPLMRATAFPAATAPAAKADYPPVRNVSVDAPPPAGTLAHERGEHPAVEAYVVDAAAGLPGVAVVNIYKPKRETQLWELDAKTPTRFSKPRNARFEADQSKWVMSDAETVLALPAGRVLIQMHRNDPGPRESLHVWDVRTDRLTSLGQVQPDPAQGLPFKFVDALQIAPQTALVLYHTDQVRLGAERYVNQYDHLRLFSARHPDGLEIVKLGLDDGSVRGWGMVGNVLWLRTSDDRIGTPNESYWSLDLGRVL